MQTSKPAAGSALGAFLLVAVGLALTILGAAGATDWGILVGPPVLASGLIGGFIAAAVRTLVTARPIPPAAPPHMGAQPQAGTQPPWSTGHTS